MARGRNRLAYIGSPLYGLQRTKGHSTLPQRSYGLLSGRSRYYLDEETVPGTYRPPTTFYPGADYYMADAMSSHATALSTDTVYDNMDLAARSRGKDKRLMSQVNAALAYASPSTPARARASRRANRQQQQQQPVAATISPSTYSSAYRVPYQDIDFTPAYNPDRYDRFNLRARQRAARVYTPGGVASKASPKPSGAKAIRSTEGYSKPKNLLSWQQQTIYS